MPIATIMFDRAGNEDFRKASTALNALSGVDSATIHPDTSSITVAYDNEVTNLNQLRKTVQAHGIQVVSEWNS